MILNQGINSRRESLFGRLDYTLLGIYFLLLVIGWINIYSSEYSESQKLIIDFNMSHGKQIMWVGISLLIGFFILMLDVRIYHTLGYVFYAAMLVLVVVTIFVGKVVNGAQGWLQIGGFQLQSAEPMKVATALALAKFLSNYGIDLKLSRDKALSFGIIFLPCILVLAQNDTGSALVFLSLFIVLFRQGLQAWFIVLPVWVGVVSLMVLIFSKLAVIITLTIIAILGYFILRRSLRMVFVLIACYILSAGVVFGIDFAYNKVLKDYQRDRIEVLIGKKIDMKGAGYNVHQSLIAIGSGGFIGKGFLKGTQTKYNFVPEQTTDFIFCTIGEEYGFIGSLFLVVLYLLLMRRIIIIAERQKFIFNRCYAYGVLSIIFIHFLINISMTLGLFPVIGIPLPFVSYGGSAMVGFSILIFILLKLDAANRSAY
jgi:rod shape determining protein RodA